MCAAFKVLLPWLLLQAASATPAWADNELEALKDITGHKEFAWHVHRSGLRAPPRIDLEAPKDSWRPLPYDSPLRESEGNGDPVPGYFTRLLMPVKSLKPDRIKRVARAFGNGDARMEQELEARMRRHLELNPGEPFDATRLMPWTARRSIGKKKAPGKNCHYTALSFFDPSIAKPFGPLGRDYFEANFKELKRGERLGPRTLVVLRDRRLPRCLHSFVYLGGQMVYQTASNDSDDPREVNTLKGALMKYGMSREYARLSFYRYTGPASQFMALFSPGSHARLERVMAHRAPRRSRKMPGNR